MPQGSPRWDLPICRWSNTKWLLLSILQKYFKLFSSSNESAGWIHNYPVGPITPSHLKDPESCASWDPSFLWSALSCPPLVSEADTECRPFTWTGGLSADSLLAAGKSIKPQLFWSSLGTIRKNFKALLKIMRKPTENPPKVDDRSSSSPVLNDNFGGMYAVLFEPYPSQIIAVLGVVTGTEAEWSPSPAGRRKPIMLAAS